MEKNNTNRRGHETVSHLAQLSTWHQLDDDDDDEERALAKLSCHNKSKPILLSNEVSQIYTQNISGNL